MTLDKKELYNAIIFSVVATTFVCTILFGIALVQHTKRLDYVEQEVFGNPSTHSLDRRVSMLEKGCVMITSGTVSSGGGYWDCSQEREYDDT